MAKIQKRIRIELTTKEKKFLDSFLCSLYEIEPDDRKISEILCDIYDSDLPQEDESSSEWKGSVADIIIKDSVREA